MNFDARINDEGKIFNMFSSSAEKATQYIEHSGYFASDLWTMSDLDDCEEGILGAVEADNAQGPYYNQLTGRFYAFFIPVDHISENNTSGELRPFTLDEFMGEFKLGAIVRYRRKDHPKEIHTGLFTGYSVYPDQPPRVTLAGRRLTLDNLFFHYEFEILADFAPFGTLK